MKTHNLGYPRIGDHRELKKACEKYWAGELTEEGLQKAGREIRRNNWQEQIQAGINIVPCNDFSFYDHVLDHLMIFNIIPQRFKEIERRLNRSELYFALARGIQRDDLDVTALEMSKWFNTNYHYIVPEFYADQQFSLHCQDIVDYFNEAHAFGIINPKVTIIAPFSLLKLGKSRDKSIDPVSLIHSLLPLYFELFGRLSNEGVRYIQIDEPFLCTRLSGKEQSILQYSVAELVRSFPELHFILATYFGSVLQNKGIISQWVRTRLTLHVDLAGNPEQLTGLLNIIPDDMNLSLGVVNGRNIWKNDFSKSLDLISEASKKLGDERIMIAPSCSLLHVPCDLENEESGKSLPSEVRTWMSFAKQKLEEVHTLSELHSSLKSDPDTTPASLILNSECITGRRNSSFVNDNTVKARMKGITANDFKRSMPYSARREMQQQEFNLPSFTTTTIGSFPQTKELRSTRSKFRKGEITTEEYESLIKDEIRNSVQWQEEAGLDVLVHGEFERNDMVEYFGEQLRGFAFTENDWVQSYGSRCVKPPVIYGDVSRPEPMTIKWITFTQGITKKPVKGMLTGPVTILQWSFIRDDQPRHQTAMQIALAIRDEVIDLEKAGIKIIQVDEPAIREGLPLNKSDWPVYLDWAVKAFRLTVSGVRPKTQIHTHMCYSDFNDIITAIADMDADVITIETSRSHMELLDVFAEFRYPSDIGPGVYDIHSPRIPTVHEIACLLRKACEVIPFRQLWVNPDCGLKTRAWSETKSAIANMVSAAQMMRNEFF